MEVCTPTARLNCIRLQVDPPLRRDDRRALLADTHRAQHPIQMLEPVALATLSKLWNRRITPRDPPKDLAGPDVQAVAMQAKRRHRDAVPVIEQLGLAPPAPSPPVHRLGEGLAPLEVFTAVSSFGASSLPLSRVGPWLRLPRLPAIHRM